jgi:hypothetical protein
MQTTELARGYRAEAIKRKPLAKREERGDRTSEISFSAKTATTFTSSFPSPIVQDLAATSWLFLSAASNWTIHPATLFCPEQVPQRSMLPVFLPNH